MIGEVILKNKLFSGESINIEYKVEINEDDIKDLCDKMKK